MDRVEKKAEGMICGRDGRNQSYLPIVLIR